MSAASWEDRYAARQAQYRAEGRLRTAQEHTARARELLVEAFEAMDGYEFEDPPHLATFRLGMAQVHATLAVAVAMLGAAPADVG